MKQPNIFHPPPSNETLSHSNGKVVFDHGPNQAISFYLWECFESAIQYDMVMVVIGVYSAK